MCRFPCNVELVYTSLFYQVGLGGKQLQDEKMPRNSAYRQRFRASRINVRKSTRDQILNESGNVEATPQSEVGTRDLGTRSSSLAWAHHFFFFFFHQYILACCLDYGEASGTIDKAETLGRVLGAGAKVMLSKKIYILP